MKNRSVNYNLPEPLIDWVAEYARRTTRTKSGVIRVAVEGLAIRAGADMLDLVGDDQQSEPIAQ